MDSTTSGPRSSAMRLTRRELLARSVALGGGAAAIGLLAACSAAPSAGTTTAPSTGGAAATPTRGGSLTYDQALEPDLLDPAVAKNGDAAIDGLHVFDTLVWFDQSDLTYKPFLADSWEASADGSQYTFKLRKDVKFHDGTALNADAVKFSFDRIVDPKTPAGVARTKLGPDYSGTDVVDDSTVRVRFKNPNPALLANLSDTWLGIVSPTAVRKLGDDFARKPVGSGPFVFKEWAAKESITFTRNPDYNWAPAPLRHGAANLDQIVLKFIPDFAAKGLAFEAGDFYYDASPVAAEFARIKDNPKYKPITGGIASSPQGIYINASKAPTSNPEVRQAIMYGLDRKAINQLVSLSVFPEAYGPLSPATPYYSKKVESLFAFDRAKANQILDAGGWTRGSDGIRAKGGVTLSLQFVGIQAEASLLSAVQAQLKEIGIAVEQVITDVTRRVQLPSTGQVHLAARYVPAADPIVLSTQFHSRNNGNTAWAQIRDSKLDDLLDQAAATADTNKRRQLYEDAQLQIMNDAVFFPLEARNRLGLMWADKVTGVRMDQRGHLLDAAYLLKP